MMLDFFSFQRHHIIAIQSSTPRQSQRRVVCKEPRPPSAISSICSLSSILSTTIRSSISVTLCAISMHLPRWVCWLYSFAKVSVGWRVNAAQAGKLDRDESWVNNSGFSVPCQCSVVLQTTFNPAFNPTFNLRLSAPSFFLFLYSKYTWNRKSFI